MVSSLTEKGALATLEGSRDDPEVRLGLEALRGIGAELASRIAQGAPWEGPEDLVRRAGVQQHHLESLAAAGALDCFGTSRRAQAWAAGAAAQATPDRLAGVVTGLVAPELPTPSEMERVADDLWSMGLTTEATAIALVRASLDARGVTGTRGGGGDAPPTPRDRERGGVFEPRGRDWSRERDLLEGSVDAMVERGAFVAGSRDSWFLAARSRDTGPDGRKC